MPWRWVEPTTCTTRRDCDCCGARGRKVCVERAGHDGVHALLCEACGRGRVC